MNYLQIFIIYYVIGLFVSGYFIYRFRFSKKYKTPSKNTDSIGGLIGTFIWPLQILFFILTYHKTNKLF